MVVTALEFKDVYKSYPVPRRLRQMLCHPFARRKKEALHGVTLQVASGELLTIMGPTGSGKTSLLKIIATLVLPNRGTAMVWGHRVGENDTAVKRRVGFVVSDERSFYWRLTGRENLNFFAAMQGFGGKERARRVEESQAIVNLEDVIDERFTGYSSGMRQKLAIARGLLHDPDMVIMDEPTRSLDPADQAKLATFIVNRLAGELGRTVILATHDLTLVERVGRRAVFLQAGRIQGLGTREELAAVFGVVPSWKVELETPGARVEELQAVAGVKQVTRLDELTFRVISDSGVSPGVVLKNLVVGDFNLRAARREEASWDRVVAAAYGEVQTG